MNHLKFYYGRVPACGVFCGGCPTYLREENPCPGADKNNKICEVCTTFHLCGKKKEINHCYECKDFPCKLFKNFSRRWLKYGQDLIENQKLLKKVGVEKFLNYYNSMVESNTNSPN